VSAQARAISNFALTHFKAAKLFSQKTQDIERAHVGQKFGNFWQEICIYCALSVMTAAASLEALINELFLAPGPLQDAVNDFDVFFWGKSTRGKKRNDGLERKPALEKYKKAVKLLGGTALSPEDKEFSAAEALIAFRNYLVHFKPLWDHEGRDNDLKKSLSGLFELSPYADEGASFLEKKCMSAGCSEWAVQTVVDFVGYFSDRSGLVDNKLNAFR